MKLPTHGVPALAGLLLSSILASAASQPTPAKFTSEYDLLRHLPTAALSGMLTNVGQPDAQGFIGFHQRDGTWYEAGMQRGGCWMLIGAAVAGDEKKADQAWKSVETTFAHQVEDGGFLSNRKPDATHAPTFDDRVETAYFYLQELAHAILVVRASPLEGHFHERINALEPKLRRASEFIESGYDGIIKKVSQTSNRLFIAAKAFGLCGAVLHDEHLTATSRKLVSEALKHRDGDGVFIERGGRDSSYNAVSLLMAQVLGLYLPDSELDAALVPAMAWQRTRIRPTGEVQILGNTRTGSGQEHMMGHIKEVNYREVALALCYFGMLHNDTDALALAEKVHLWREKR